MDYTRARLRDIELKREDTEVRAGLTHMLSMLLGN